MCTEFKAPCASELQEPPCLPTLHHAHTRMCLASFLGTWHEARADEQTKRALWVAWLGVGVAQSAQSQLRPSQHTDCSSVLASCTINFLDQYRCRKRAAAAFSAVGGSLMAAGGAAHQVLSNLSHRCFKNVLSVYSVAVGGFSSCSTLLIALCSCLLA